MSAREDIFVQSPFILSAYERCTAQSILAEECDMRRPVFSNHCVYLNIVRFQSTRNRHLAMIWS